MDHSIIPSRKVSVLMITYNHERYIARAIESVLAQEVNFNYEILIGEDCSLDETRKILQGYQAANPDKVRLFLNDKNIGMQRNFKQIYDSSSGDYVAILEGDDYWISNDKLQKQVSFMENNPEYSLCFHDVQILDDQNHEVELNIHDHEDKEEFTVADILRKNFLHISSVLLRRSLLEKYPDWFLDLPLGDWPLFVMIALRGKFFLLRDIIAVYTVHKQGYWSQQSWKARYQKTVVTALAIKDHLCKPYKKKIDKTISSLYFDMARNSYNEGDKNVIKYLFIAFFYDKRKVSSLLINSLVGKAKRFI